MEIVETLINRYPCLASCKESIESALDAIIETYRQGGKLLLSGNGGSAADCGHISGELLKGFLSKRPLPEEEKAAMKASSPALSDDTLNKLQGGLPALPLTELSAALSTAFSNDVDPNLIYAQLVHALGQKGDILIAISTSGNAENCLQAALVAKGKGIRVLSLTGEGGGKLGAVADIAIRVPEKETFKVQELHLPVYHALCAGAEKALF